MDERAEEIQARAEAKREQRASEIQAAKTGEPSRQSVETDEVTKVCRQCGEDFTATITMLDGARLTSGPSECGDCIELEKYSHPAIPQTDVRARLEHLGVNVRAHGTYEVTDFGKKTTAMAERFAEGVRGLGPWDAMQSLYIHGDVGVGKTQLGVSILRLILQSGYHGRVRYDRARSLITEVQDRYGTGTVTEVSDSVRACGVWMLDDVGAEKPTADAFRILEDMLDRRQGHPMIWTSNLGPEELSVRWAGEDGAERFRSRLATFDFLELEGGDRRFTS
jgi:chromosomal replication initiation ATPase DnaA